MGESGAWWGGADGAGDDVRLTRATHCADCRLAEEQQICVSVQQMVGAQRVNQRPLVPDHPTANSSYVW